MTLGMTVQNGGAASTHAFAVSNSLLQQFAVCNSAGRVATRGGQLDMRLVPGGCIVVLARRALARRRHEAVDMGTWALLSAGGESEDTITGTQKETP